MGSLSQGIAILIFVICVEGFLMNFYFTRLPKIWGDILIERPGIRLYIPLTSAVVISVFVSLFLRHYRYLIPF